MIFGKNDIYDLLNAKNIPFTCTEHRPVYSMEEFDVLDIPANAVICKNLFLRNSNGKQHFLLTVPAATPVDLKELAVKLASSRLSFASAERLEKYLGLQSGLVSPFRPVERYKQKRYLRQQQKLTAIRHHRYSSER